MGTRNLYCAPCRPSTIQSPSDVNCGAAGPKSVRVQPAKPPVPLTPEWGRFCRKPGSKLPDPGQENISVPEINATSRWMVSRNRSRCVDARRTVRAVVSVQVKFGRPATLAAMRCRARSMIASGALAVSLFARTKSGPPPVAAKAEVPTQSKPAESPIQVQVNEVIVPVTVTDERGRFVTDLEQKDFRIFDEGKEQKIEYFSRERSQPVVVGFLIDMSNTSRLTWKNYKDAAIELVDTLLPGDKKYSGYLIAYSSDAELLQNTTSDGEAIVEKIRKLKPGGGAALYDAVWKACTSHDLVKGEPIEPRRVLVIMGDGHDTASR